LISLVEKLDQTFSQPKAASVQYGLLGYGYKLANQPSHMFTVNSAPFGDKISFPASARNMLIENTQISAEEGSVISALNHAARYPFRPTSARHIILIPCSECPIKQQTETIAALLREQNIVLHVVTDLTYNFPGFTKDTILPNLDASLSARYLEMIHNSIVVDHCLKVALDSNGVVFNALYLTEGHVASQRQFTELLSNQILKASVHPATVECQCLHLDDGAKLLCKRIEEAV